MSVFYGYYIVINGAKPALVLNHTCMDVDRCLHISTHSAIISTFPMSRDKILLS